MGGHFTGALPYADDITLLCMSGLRTLSKVCEEYATEFDVTFNGKKSKLLFFRGRECVFSNLNIYVCGQLVDMCDSATHLGHFIHQQIRTVLLNQQNLVSGEVLIFLCLILVNCHILSNVNYLINIAVLFMDHRCGL